MPDIKLNSNSIIGVAGAGAMGLGIAQVAATAGYTVKLFDTRTDAANQAVIQLGKTLSKLAEKNKITSEEAVEIINRVKPVNNLKDFNDCSMVIEAIVENLSAKQELYKQLEHIISPESILASNTSSLSVTALASVCIKPGRVIGLHFFNPAALMPLVEIIPAMQTSADLPDRCVQLMNQWKKIPVIARDTPGFIVNRVARPFYGEALRIYEEGIANPATIDWAMKEFGGFKMGPFELMDLIGNDINYTVTETVWTQCYFDSRYKPSIIQKKMVESGRLGRKSSKGYFDYADGAIMELPTKNEVLAKSIVERILAMLMNEAADALYYKIATKEDIDLAMTKGVNYPKGLLKWIDETGVDNLITQLNNLYSVYEEDRYRCSVLLKQMSAAGKKFYS